jgi:prepilin-type N-terminal cleavage/methylation domain-containing protein
MMSSHSRRARRGGFTLLEMIVVLTLIAIAAAMGLPKINTIVQRQHVDRAAMIVASDIRSAFTSAARGRVPVRVDIPANATKYVITNTVTGDTIVRRNFTTGDLSVAGLAGSSVSLVVFPNGVATAADTVTVNGIMGYRRKLLVTRVGFVRMLQ